MNGGLSARGLARAYARGRKHIRRLVAEHEAEQATKCAQGNFKTEAQDRQKPSTGDSHET
jgi:hypothetical protein